MISLLTFSLLSAAPGSLALHDAGGQRGDTHLRFVLHSQKAGFIDSAVEGHVQDFGVSYEWTGDAARHTRVAFAGRDMRTDNGARDEKMWGYCLDVEHHPRVEVQLDADIPVGRPVQVPGRIHIRGAWHPLKLTAQLRRAGDALLLSGGATVKLSELGIPDPSIWIAKVDDTVELAFQVKAAAPVTATH
jgi:polyisoprenoid-binding protein YceI